VESRGGAPLKLHLTLPLVALALALGSCAHAPQTRRAGSDPFERLRGLVGVVEGVALTPSACPQEFELLESGACLAVPPDLGSQTPLILYLHGMYAVDQPEEELAIEARVGRAAKAHGFAVLAPRGELGLCDWSAEFLRWRCWPNQAQQKPKAGEILLGLGPLFRATSKRTGIAAVKPFVLGFSNGAFFAALIAADTQLPVRGFAIFHGGPVEPTTFQANRAVPSLLVAAADDPWQKPKMDRLHNLMNEGGWPNKYEIRSGKHELTDTDIVKALAFFTSHLVMR
jgi:poly(3-hydroxybutyrate) depolymerase